MRDLEIESEARNEKYLGLPVYIGRSKTQPFKTMTLASNHSGGKTRVFGLGAPILNSRRVLICYKTCTIIFEKEKIENGKPKATYDHGCTQSVVQNKINMICANG